MKRPTTDNELWDATYGPDGPALHLAAGCNCLLNSFGQTVVPCAAHLTPGLLDPATYTAPVVRTIDVEQAVRGKR